MRIKEHIQWFLAELPQLVKDAVISQDIATSLKTHYLHKQSSIKEVSRFSIVFSVFGALLVGGGIILILAYNWNDIPRTVRLTLVLGLLVCSQLLAGKAVFTGQGDDGFKEGAAVFCICAFMASVSLVAQIYHIPGDMTRYFLISALAAVPLMYLTYATAASVLFLILAVCWASSAQLDGGTAMWFWPLLAISIPVLKVRLREEPLANRTLIFAWVFLLAIVTCAGVTLEKSIPGLWMVLYASIFSIFYMYEPGLMPRSERFWTSPMKSVSAVGGPIFLLMLTHTWPWQGIGWAYYRHGYRFHGGVAILDYVLVILALGFALLLVVNAAKMREWDKCVYGVMPLVVSICYATSELARIPVLVAMNFYVLFLGVRTVLKGIKEEELLVLNGGMGLVCLLALFRFFDWDMSLLTRGICFILVGAGFVLANTLLRRKWKMNT